MHTAFSADTFSAKLRDVLVGGGLPGIPGGLDPTNIPALPQRVAGACLNSILDALRSLGMQVQLTRAYTDWARLHPATASAAGITALQPSRGCPGDEVDVLGTGFGSPDPLVQVAFTGANGNTVLARTVDGAWSDTRITVVAPEGVASGPVGLVRFPAGSPPAGDPLGASLDAIAEVGTCLGASGEVFRHRLWEGAVASFAGLPELPGIPGAPAAPNWFGGGRPVIRGFAVDGGNDAEISPGATLTLTWQVENADAVDIVPIRAGAGDRNQLPNHPGAANTAGGSWTTGQIPVDWAWAGGYELRATNPCSQGAATTARVTVRAVPAAAESSAASPLPPDSSREVWTTTGARGCRTPTRSST